MAQRGWRTVLVLVSALSVACGGDGDDGSGGGGAAAGGDACEAAEQKFADCKPGSVLQISRPCSGDAKATADCMLSSSCEQIDGCVLGGGGAAGAGSGVGGFGAVGALPGFGGTGS